jgi:hypothetical protein
LKLLAIDPGPERSAAVLYDTETRQPQIWSHAPNRDVLADLDDTDASELAVEMVASYGMAVGAEVFETVYWIGRFCERWEMWDGHPDARRIFRREVKTHLCADSRAKDANIRQALIDRYGPGKEKAIGLKASPGPLYGLHKHCWSALAVAVTAAETRLVEAAA